MTKFKITRLNKIKEDGVVKRVVIGITASDGVKSTYMDWTEDIKNIGKTKSDLISYIKKHMKEVVNQSEIDEAKEKKAELEAKLQELKNAEKGTAGIEEELSRLNVPKPITRAQAMKNQLNRPVITYEKDEKIINTEITI